MFSRRIRRSGFLALAAFVAACGGGGDDGTTNPPPGGNPAITVALSGATLSLAQGANGTVTVTVGRSGGFAGAIDLSLEGAPAGVTGAFAPASVANGSTTSTLTLTVGGAVAAGTSTLTVRAKGTGVTDQTATLALTVTAVATPSFTLALASPTLSVAQGASGTATANITRAGGFTGAVNIAVTGAPANVTATPNPASIATGATQSTITVAVGAGVAPGNYTLTVTGSGTGVSNQTATLTLTVTAAASGSYTLSLTPATLSIQQGNSNTSTVNVNRTGGFTGSVALAASGAPTGVTVTLNPTSTTGNTSTATVAVGTTVTPGSYNITFTGTATGITNQTTTLALTVTAATGGSGNTTFDFCGDVTAIPIWFAFQDGTGAWTKVTPTGNSYKFNITQARGGVAWVTPSAGGGFTTSMFFGTQAELSGQGGTVCGTPATKTVNGSVAGLALTDFAAVSLGSALVNVIGATGSTFQLKNVPDGPRDLVAGRASLGAGGSLNINKLIIRRGLNQADGSTLPVLDFGSSEAFDPVARTLTVANGGSDQITASELYATANGSSGVFFTALLSGATNTYYGVPAAKQVNTDLHQLFVSGVTGGSNPTAFRSVINYFKDAVDKTITLGPAVNALTVTTAATTPYVRLRAQTTLQTEYSKVYSLVYTQSSQANARAVSISATSGYLNGTAVDITIPDFTTAAYDVNWALKTGSPVQWTGTGASWTTTGGITTTPLVDGGTMTIGTRLGSITP